MRQTGPGWRRCARTRRSAWPGGAPSLCRLRAASKALDLRRALLWGAAAGSLDRLLQANQAASVADAVRRLRIAASRARSDDLTKPRLATACRPRWAR
mmetsp:Transcript_53118/g.134757  ORF Transcript_53118/g.134757 Transcript_53118/m.134757 type:complete len:98 (+) Transcript_53118:160-453(+)